MSNHNNTLPHTESKIILLLKPLGVVNQHARIQMLISKESILVWYAQCYVHTTYASFFFQKDRNVLSTLQYALAEQIFQYTPWCTWRQWKHTSSNSRWQISSYMILQCILNKCLREGNPVLWEPRYTGTFSPVANPSKRCRTASAWPWNHLQHVWKIFLDF
jgi:hypothetical protein